MTTDNSTSAEMSGVLFPSSALDKDEAPGNLTSVAGSLAEKYINSFGHLNETRNPFHLKASFLPALFQLAGLLRQTISTTRFVKSEKGTISFLNARPREIILFLFALTLHQSTV
jgi:hypothetical protein